MAYAQAIDMRLASYRCRAGASAAAGESETRRAQRRSDESQAVATRESYSVAGRLLPVQRPRPPRFREAAGHQGHREPAREVGFRAQRRSPGATVEGDQG